MNFTIDIPRLLQALGINAVQQGNRWKATCPDPSHPRPAGKVSTPSWSIVDDGTEEAGSHFCHGCRFRGGPWELVAAVRAIPLEEAGKWVSREMLGTRAAEFADIPEVRIVTRRQLDMEMRLPPGVCIPSVDGSEWFPEAYRYLIEERGLEDWQVKRWHIGYAIRGRCAYRVVVPVHTNGRLLSYVGRAFLDNPLRYYVADKKKDPGARPELALFGEAGFDYDVGVATVSEGLWGALAFERAGAPNPCAILGASNLKAEKIALLAGFPTLLVATDPDAAGDASFQVIHDALCRWSDVRRVPLLAKPDERLFFGERGAQLLRRAWETAMVRRRVWGTESQPLDV